MSTDQMNSSWPEGDFSDMWDHDDDSAVEVTLLGRALRLVVAVLGVAGLAVSTASTVPLGFSVHFSLLAGVVAAVTLIPGHSRHLWASVPLAAVGLADAVSTWTTTGLSGWPLAVITVLNALQTLAALAALFCDSASTRHRTAGTSAAAGYHAYAQAYQAYQNLIVYQQYSSSSQEPATAQADSAAQSREALHAKYAAQQPSTATSHRTAAAQLSPLRRDGMSVSRAAQESVQDTGSSTRPAGSPVRPQG